MPSFAKPWSVPALILVQENYRTPQRHGVQRHVDVSQRQWRVANKSGLACSVYGTNLSKPCPWMFHGVGRSTALFYAKSQLQETGATIGLNQTDVMASLHRSLLPPPAIYQGFWAANSPCAHKLESNARGNRAGFAPTHRVKFIGSGSVPGAEQSARWQFDAWEQGLTKASPKSPMSASTQFVLGAQLRIGSTMWGFEQRWFSFLGDTREYILAGASNTSTPSYLHEHRVAILNPIVHHQAKKSPAVAGLSCIRGEAS